MPKSICRGLRANCGRTLILATLAGLSACENSSDGADVSFNTVDQNNLTNEIVQGQMDWQWDVNDANGASATFEEVTTGIRSNSALKTTVVNVNTDSLNTEANDEADIEAGIKSVAVTPGKTYSASTLVQGPTCGFTTLEVRDSTNAETVLMQKKVFFDGSIQAIDYYFEAEEGVESVDIPFKLAYPSNISGDVYIGDYLISESPIPAGAGGENLVANGGFESSSDLATYDWGNSNDDRATYSVDTTVTQGETGSNSVKIVFADTGLDETSSNPYDVEAGPIDVPIDFDGLYTFSVWIKAAEGSAGAKANFLVQNPTAYNVFAEQEIIASEEWQEVTFEAQITGTDTVRLYAQLNFTENNGKTIYVDNYQLVPPPTCPYQPTVENLVSTNEASFEYNHVTNGSLESGDTSAWLTETSGGDMATFSVAQATTSNGDNAFRADITSVGENTYDIQAGPNNIYVEPGKTYVYSGFGFATPGAEARFTAALQASPYTVYEAQWIEFGGYWQQISFDFTIPSDAPTLNAEELAAAGLAEDAVVTRINLPVQLSYENNEGKKIFLDDFSLLPNAAVAGDLEDATTNEDSGWSWTASEGSSATYRVTKEDAHSGEQSLRVDVTAIANAEEGPETNAVEVGIDNISLTGGLKYYVSARIKGDSGTKAALVFANATETSNAFSEVGKTLDDDGNPEGVELSGDWQEIYTEGVVPPGVESASVMLQLGFEDNVKETFYIDTIRVTSQVPVVDNLVSLNEEIFKSNVVANGGLENSETTASGWSGYANGTGEGTFGVDSTEAHSGNNAYKIAVTALPENSWEIEAGPDNIPVTAGETYIFSAWVKGSSGAQVNVSASLGEAPWTTFGSQGLTLDGTWQQAFFEITIPEPAIDPETEELEAPITAIRARVQAGAESNLGAEIYIDDVVLIHTLVSNGGFEQGNGGDDTIDAVGWESPDNDFVSISLDTNEAHTGSNSLKLEHGTLTSENNPWDSQLFYNNIPVAGGTTYQFSARIKGDGGMQAKFLVGQQEGSYSEFGSATIDVSAGWQEVTFDATVPNDETMIRVGLQSGYEGNTDKTFYVDSFKLVPKPVLPNGSLEASASEATGWGSGGVTASIDTSTAQSGVNSLKAEVGAVTVDNNPWDAQVGISNIPVVDGTTYKFTGWIKGTAGTKANFLIQLPVDPWSTFGSFEVTLPDDEWQWVEFEAQIETAEELVNLQVHMGYEESSDATFYFDNFKMVPTGPNPVEEVEEAEAETDPEAAAE